MTKKFNMVVFGFALLLLLVGSIVQFNKTHKSKNNDFRVYYKTSERIENNNWDDIFTRKDGAFPYRYVPYSLMSITWLNHFTEIEARKVWVVIQALSFFAGFYFIYLALIELESPWPLRAVSFSAIFSFRYFMDSLCSGQVAGLMFLSFALGLYLYLKKRFYLNELSNSFSSSLKIVPGLLLIHGLVKARSWSERVKLLLAGIILFIALNLILLAWLAVHDPSISALHVFAELWRNWLAIVLADGEYFDGSTAKNQAIRGVYLRMLGRVPVAETLWQISVGLGTLGLLWLWCKKSKTHFQEAYSYCLGILGFILFMPESLPYQIMNVTIPLAIILGHPKMKISQVYKSMLFLFLIFMSLPSSDFIGKKASEWIQAQSLPFFVMLLIAHIMVAEIRERT